MRVFALSDVHVDYQENMSWLAALSLAEYGEDVLLLAGDVSHDLGRMAQAFEILLARFGRLFFVPGNHDLWLLGRPYPDSIAKFEAVLALCRQMGVETAPAGIGPVMIVPLFSWYIRPEEGRGSLFVPKNGEDPNLTMWSDNYFVRWPLFADYVPAASHFLHLNTPYLQAYDRPVISFSHFLPRADLMYSLPEERRAWVDPLPAFNFSRVAGCQQLDQQIRQLGAKVHLYGHQHHNRFRPVEGVVYLSHCLGYPKSGHSIRQPRQIWPMAAPI